jgi:hypothetical protein
MLAQDHALQHDEHVQIPVSVGIPTGVRISFLACIGLAILVLGLVIAASAANHVWPSSASLKVPL